MTITAVIITKNEAKNIARCLDSLTGVVDEIIVLDAFSTDTTQAICQSYPTARFIQREWDGYAASKNFANAQATSDYILSLDADEMLSLELKKNILKARLTFDGSTAYQFNRLNYIAQHPIHHSGWYPDRKVRLFPKKTAEWVGDFAHETLQTAAQMDTIKGDLWHFTSPSFEQMAEKQFQYAELGAQELHKKNKHVSFITHYGKVFFKFFSIYILKMGFLDGISGFKIARISAQALHHKFITLNALKTI